MMVGRHLFPFGKAYSQGYRLVSGRLFGEISIKVGGPLRFGQFSWSTSFGMVSEFTVTGSRVANLTNPTFGDSKKVTNFPHLVTKRIQVPKFGATVYLMFGCFLGCGQFPLHRPFSLTPSSSGT